MSQPPISRFPVPEIADLPEDIRARILAVQDKSGFVPNVFLVLARRPDEFRAVFAYHVALMDALLKSQDTLSAESNPNKLDLARSPSGAPPPGAASRKEIQS